MPARAILVTGATGTVGSEVLASLADDGDGRRASDDVERVRAGVRNVGADDLGDGYAPADSSRPAVDAVEFDFERPETWGFAFEGVRAMFLVRPPSVPRERVVAAAEAAVRSGVEHVVYLSVLGAERNPLLPHRRIEKRLESADARCTFLRASYFMQNVTGIHAPEIRDCDEVFVPAGDGRISFVDARDVGAVAAAALAGDGPGRGSRAYDLTGPAALDFSTVAAVLSDSLGRRIVYADPGPVEFVRRMRARDVPLGFAVAMLGIYAPARFGRAGRVTDDVERALGRPPTSLRAFVDDSRDAWVRT
ncbi:NmrA family NAD(P)-binding protein [Halegenticoccus tardaugens]|uniref:NmrA family NAD(P)-binding protein n=1 Tax=Halegenticoccus tardaugens TaxID=2071624 RepID=UPI00100B201F|nr:NmrA family NAD(P)-binding protein [Halegenticoccus tardaugens]